MRTHTLGCRVACFGFVLGTLLIAGCGGSQNKTASISGGVQFSGEPIAVGEIRFVPIQGTKARTVGGMIRAGKYEISGSQGLPVGEYRVEIVGYRNRDGSSREIDLADAEADYEQYVPPKHNKNTQATVSVVTTDEPLVMDFSLSR